MARPKADAATAWAPDDTNPRTNHRLAGLEPDNLLAFMALLGLLRALEEARPAWRPRAFWDVATHPWRPVLTLGEGQTEAAVAKAAAEGVKRLGASHRFADDARDIKFTTGDFGKLYLEGDERRRTVLDALMCDGAVKDDGMLWPTPFCELAPVSLDIHLSREDRRWMFPGCREVSSVSGLMLMMCRWAGWAGVARPGRPPAMARPQLGRWRRAGAGAWLASVRWCFG